MKIVCLFLGLILLWLIAVSPSALEIEGNQNERDFGIITRRREPTIHEVLVASFRQESALAIRVFKCESGLNPRAVSATGDYGIGQINLESHRRKIQGENDVQKIEWLFDYKNNIRLARSLYDASGWGPWDSSRACWG